MRHFLPILLACSTVVGCGSEAEPDESADAADAPFARGKADGSVPDEGSVLALAVLRVANELSYEELDDSTSDGGVGLDRRAAQGIVERRAGLDGSEPTADDTPFETLAQLDAVPYVGPRALSRLLAYAQAGGYVQDPDIDPQTEVFGIAEGSQTAADILALVNGQTSAFLDDEVRLSNRAANNIVAHRAGPDGVEGTADDDTVDSLTELDGIAQVGEATIRALQIYVSPLWTDGLLDERYSRYFDPSVPFRVRRQYADGADYADELREFDFTVHGSASEGFQLAFQPAGEQIDVDPITGEFHGWVDSAVDNFFGARFEGRIDYDAETEAYVLTLESITWDATTLHGGGSVYAWITTPFVQELFDFPIDPTAHPSEPEPDPFVDVDVLVTDTCAMTSSVEELHTSGQDFIHVRYANSAASAYDVFPPASQASVRVRLQPGESYEDPYAYCAGLPAGSTSSEGMIIETACSEIGITVYCD